MNNSVVVNNPNRIPKSEDVIQNNREKFIDWITFYRRNIHRFVEHYFGIELFPYQILWMYLMGISTTFCCIGSRATAKTWLLAVFSCAIAVLYPNSEIVVCASTKEQAGIIVSDKIANLRGNYPNLDREISKITDNMNKWEVNFHNGSVIRIVASRESSRGKRATFTIYEEFRLIDKKVLDSVIRPFSYIRQTPYLKKKKWKKYKDEFREVFISSAYHKGLWWYDEVKSIIKRMILTNGEKVNFLAIDYIVSIVHNIKTMEQIEADKANMDYVTALEEYDNIPWGESSDAYFTLNMFNRRRILKRAFYPQRIETYNKKGNPYQIPKVNGEIRVLCCDIAQKGGSTNDLSITGCLRAIPSNKGYLRELSYMESYSGEDSVSQSLRIRQLYNDFDADFIVIDLGSGGGGIGIYDTLGRPISDIERDIVYSPLTVIDDSSIKDYEQLRGRTGGLDPLPVIFPIVADAKLNAMIAIVMRRSLQDKMWGFLVDEIEADEYLISKSCPFRKEFSDTSDLFANAFFKAPYVETSLFINECISLIKQENIGHIKLVEAPGRRKDRYSSISYGNYFISLLEKDLLKETEESDNLEDMIDMFQII